ncbi:MAG: hypothetical protein WCB31_06775, partial [Nitrososphaeraceae archaeon]
MPTPRSIFSVFQFKKHHELTNNFNTKNKYKKIKKEWIEVLIFYGIDLLYSFPSNASLYISAT